MSSARAKAERCFALARSTTHAGERENAIAAGLRICSSAKLDPDSFDIPGRDRRRPEAPTIKAPMFSSPIWDIVVRDMLSERHAGYQAWMAQRRPVTEPEVEDDRHVDISEAEQRQEEWLRAQLRAAGFYVGDEV